MVGEIRRGKAAIQEAAESSGGGEFTPFLESIYWKDDKEERYLLFLNPMEEVPTFKMIQFIPTERGFPEMVVAKTDGFFEERVDSFAKDWDATEKETSVAVAVELEPTFETVKGRPKPTGFTIATKEYSRKVLDEEGEVTDETEDVTTPIVGVVAQSPKNFFNVLKTCDDTDWPVHETPVKIVRVGKDSNTSYNVTGYEDAEIDFSPLFEHLDGVTYLGEELADLEENIAALDDDFEAASTIGEVLLEKRILELTDTERYDRLYAGVTESMDKYGNKKKKGGKDKERKAPNRAARPSQRRAARAEAEPEADETSEDAEPSKPARKARGKRAVAKDDNPNEKLAALHAKASKTTK